MTNPDSGDGAGLETGGKSDPSAVATVASRRVWLAAAGAVWVLPLWFVRYLPMVDYPQQLAAAAILRFYGDPSRALQATFEIVPFRPQGLFEMLVAAVALVLPIEAAGKLVLSLSLLAVPVATALLCRRTGRPAAYGLLALALTYNHAFAWGFVDNLLAYPLVLFGLALADRLFDRPFGVSAWVRIALVGLAFYTVHLEFLLIFAGAVGWLALVRASGARRLLAQLSTLLPGLAAGIGALAWAHRNPESAMTAYQQNLATEASQYAPIATRLSQIPSNLFAGPKDLGAWALLALGAALALLALSSRGSSDRETEGKTLVRTRFLTLAAWVLLLYFVLPNYTRGYLVSDRLLPLAAMIAIPAFPRLPMSPARVRLAALLLGVLLAGQWMRTATGILAFSSEVEGLGELLDSTAPGQSLAGLIYEPGGEQGANGWAAPPYLIHTPAYYQVGKGGRVHFSFAQFFNSPVAYRPGKNKDDPLLAEWDEWNPQRFRYDRHASHYRYFLVRGGPERIAQAFGPHLWGLSVKRAGRWFLVERAPGVAQSTFPSTFP